MVKVVRPASSFSMADWMRRSLWVSSALVA
jgi:hypothetical protein